MPPRFLVPLLMFLSLFAKPAAARDVTVEVEVLHLSGLLAPAELEALLADPRLGIEAIYAPTRLIEGVTARRERTMPFGSRLIAISQERTLKGEQIERKGRILRFRLPDMPSGHAEYRLNHVTLRTPVPRGLGRPQPDLRLVLFGTAPEAGIHESALLSRHYAFDLGVRVRHRWSDAKGASVAAARDCTGGVQSLGNGTYRFRPYHRVAGLFDFLSPTVASDPPAKPPAGQRSLRLREPFPEPLAGWTLSRNHLVQIQTDGQLVERFSIYAEQAGGGECRRTRAYDALFYAGMPVVLHRSIHGYGCGAEAESHSVTATWLDDGSLASFAISRPQGGHAWDAFLAAAACPTGAPPEASETQALVGELQRIREAFLRP
ncbi:MAG TPA: hypothetical protein VFX67_01785 [Burkholderiales bacterium]|nr:hypothetical protein [Burkholderiales bacterium]